MEFINDLEWRKVNVKNQQRIKIGNKLIALIKKYEKEEIDCSYIPHVKITLFGDFLSTVHLQVLASLRV